MNDTAKVALAAGSGIVVGKWFGSGAGWILGGLAVLFLLNSPSTQSALKSGASRVYSSMKK